MIQRIQSIWLFLAALTIACLTFTSIGTATVNGAEFQLTASGLYQKTAGVEKQLENFLPLLVCIIALSLICLVNIFNFRNRQMQKRIAFISLLLLVGVSFWISQYLKKIPAALPDVHLGPGLFLPSVAIIFVFLAIRGIIADEKLLKSADRLR